MKAEKFFDTEVLRINSVIEGKVESNKSKPSGPFANSLQSNNIINLLILLILSFIVIFGGLFEIVSTKYQPKFKRINEIWYDVYNICGNINFLYLYFTRKSYQHFITSCESQLITKSSQVFQYIRKHRKLVHLFTALVIIVHFSIHLYQAFKYKGEACGDDYDDLTCLEIVSLFGPVAALNWIFLIQFIIESIIYLRSSFNVIQHSISSLETKSLTVERIRMLRQMYSRASDLTVQLDSFLCIPIFGLYLFLTTDFHSNLSIVYASNYSLESTIFAVTAAIIIIFFTHNIVSVNVISMQCFDKVYRLSLKNLPFPITNEIELLLYRIGRDDVGLTFAKICIISPTFVSSLATVILSIALSAPSNTSN